MNAHDVNEYVVLAEKEIEASHSYVVGNDDQRARRAAHIGKAQTYALLAIAAALVAHPLLEEAE